MDQPLVFCKRTDECKNVVVFIHGFTGGTETWRHNKEVDFPKLLLSNQNFSDRFDIAVYSYYSTVFNASSSIQNKIRTLIDLVRRRSTTSKSNIDVGELASNFGSHVRFTLECYENIYIIAHSMGGLVAKSHIITEIEKHGNTKVKGFISLAVPHCGVELATIGRLISGNPQVESLSPTKQFIIDLNERWIKLPFRPLTKYFYGTYDELVEKSSAIAIESGAKDVISVPNDHANICKPPSPDDLIVKSVSSILLDAVSIEETAVAGYQSLEVENQYEDELFVMKLIVADIPSDTNRVARELFLNAECIRKILRTSSDRQRLIELYEGIRQLYRDSYAKYLSGGIPNSGLLLAEVHEKITASDATLLRTIVPQVKSYHKQGMLHQLANDPKRDIWWTESKSLDSSGAQ